MPDLIVTYGSAPSSAFDALAATYDGAFSGSVLGRLLRERVWWRLDDAFGAGERVLDVGCGTGEDALHLASRGVHVLAIDASSEMTDRTARKVERAGLSHLVDVRTASAEAMGESLRGTPLLDGVLSNFGVLNCVPNAREIAAQLGELTRPGARAFLCVMGPAVPWEWGWYLLRGQPLKAFRRLTPGGTTWRGMRIRYPTIGALRRAFAPSFRAVGVRALGALLPPSYAEPWALRHAGLVERLAGLEEKIEAVPPFPWLADHYLLELVRR
jgi:SAM-dependent methyltransferase